MQPESSRSTVRTSGATRADQSQSLTEEDTNGSRHREKSAPAFMSPNVLKRAKIDKPKDQSPGTSKMLERELTQQGTEVKCKQDSEASSLRSSKKKQEENRLENRKVSHLQNQPGQQPFSRSQEQAQLKNQKVVQRPEAINYTSKLEKDEQDLHNFVQSSSSKSLQEHDVTVLPTTLTIRNDSNVPLISTKTHQNLSGVASMLPCQHQAPPPTQCNETSVAEDSPQIDQMNRNNTENTRCSVKPSEINELTASNHSVAPSSPGSNSAASTRKVVTTGDTISDSGSPNKLNGNNSLPITPKRSRKTAHKQEEMLAYGKSSNEMRFIFKTDEPGDEWRDRTTESSYSGADVHEDINNKTGRNSQEKSFSRQQMEGLGPNEPDFDEKMEEQMKEHLRLANIDTSINTVVFESATTFVSSSSISIPPTNETQQVSQIFSEAIHTRESTSSEKPEPRLLFHSPAAPAKVVTNPEEIRCVFQSDQSSQNIIEQQCLQSQRTFSAAEALKNLALSIPQDEKLAMDELMKTSHHSQLTSNFHSVRKRSIQNVPVTHSFKKPANQEKKVSHDSSTVENELEERSAQTEKMVSGLPTHEEQTEDRHVFECSGLSEEQNNWTHPTTSNMQSLAIICQAMKAPQTLRQHGELEACKTPLSIRSPVIEDQQQDGSQNQEHDSLSAQSTFNADRQNFQKAIYVEAEERSLRTVSSILQGTPFRIEIPTKKAVLDTLKLLFCSDFVKKLDADPDVETISAYFDRKFFCITTTFYPFQVLYGEFELDITIDATISFVLDVINPRVELRLSDRNMAIIDLQDIKKITMNNSTFIGFPSCLILDVTNMEEKIKGLSKKYSLFKPTAPKGKQIFHCHPKQLFFVLNTIPEKPSHQCAIKVQQKEDKDAVTFEIAASVGFDVLVSEYQFAFATHPELRNVKIDFRFLTDTNFYDYLSHSRLIVIYLNKNGCSKWIFKCREDLVMICDANYVDFDANTGLGYSLNPPTHRFRPLERQSNFTIERNHKCLDGFPIEFRNYAEEMRARMIKQCQITQQAAMEGRKVENRPCAEIPPETAQTITKKDGLRQLVVEKINFVEKSLPTSNEYCLEQRLENEPKRDTGEDINSNSKEPIDVETDSDDSME